MLSFDWFILYHLLAFLISRVASNYAYTITKTGASQMLGINGRERVISVNSGPLEQELVKVTACHLHFTEPRNCFELTKEGIIFRP